MASYNKVLLMGNLTRDIEMRYTPSGLAVGKFGLASTRKFKDTKTNELREDTVFVDCECWGRTAEVMSQYLTKGKPVFIEGRLKLDQWDDKATGQKRSKLLVVVDSFQFIGAPGAAAGAGGPGGGGGAPRSAPSRPAARPQAQQHGAPMDQAPDDIGPEDLNIQDESIPF